jgi:hypothetical protein
MYHVSYSAILKIFSLKSRVVNSEKATNTNLVSTQKPVSIADGNSVSESTLDSKIIPPLIFSSEVNSHSKSPLNTNNNSVVEVTQTEVSANNVKFVKESVEQAPESLNQLQNTPNAMAETEYRDDFNSPRERELVTLKFVDGKSEVVLFDKLETDHVNSVKQTMERIEELTMIISPRNASPVKAIPPSSIKPSFSKAQSPSKKLVSSSPRVSTLKPLDGYPKIDKQELSNVHPLAVLHL